MLSLCVGPSREPMAVLYTQNDGAEVISMPLDGLAQTIPPYVSSPGMVWGFAVVVSVFFWVLSHRAYRRLPSTTPLQSSPGDATGSVYVLTNPEYPNLVKIGQTSRAAQTRADELSAHTGVPTPFHVAYELKVSNPEAVEQTVHDTLSAHSVNPDREFFDVSVSTARHAIEQVAGGSARRPGRSIPSQAVGLVLMALSVWTGLLLLATPHEAMQHALNGFGAKAASHVVQDTFGYPTLLLSGSLAVWGTGLIRRRPLRPLWMPSACALALCPLLSALAGGTGHAFATTKQVGWGGQTTVFPAEFTPWAGAVGQRLAGWSRDLLGPTVSLALLSLAVVAACALALRLHEVLLSEWENA